MKGFLEKLAYFLNILRLIVILNIQIDIEVYEFFKDEIKFFPSKNEKNFSNENISALVMNHQGVHH